MSLSGSSASRKSIWAITRFARSSSMKVGRKMIRSFNRREKMSNARSPRGVCSITIGTRAIGISLSLARLGRRGPSPALSRGPNDLIISSISRQNPGVADEQLEGPAVAQSAPQRLELSAQLGAERREARELAERLRELIVQLRQHLLLHLDELDLGGPAAPAQLLPPVVVCEPERDRARLARPHPHDRRVDLGQDRLVADDELVARLARGVPALDGERVVDDQEVARAGRAVHRAELRLLLAHPLERRGDLLVGDGLGGVLDLDALVLTELDRRLHFHDGDEAER